MPSGMRHLATAGVRVAALLLCAAASTAVPARAEIPSPPVTMTDSDRDMNDVRRSYLELRRDALISGGGVVPRQGEFAVFISIDPRTDADLQSASLSVDGRVLCNERFEAEQLMALRRGTAARLCIGEVQSGATTLTVTLSGITHDKPWQQTTSLDVSRADTPSYVEVTLAHTSTKGIPDVLTNVSS